MIKGLAALTAAVAGCAHDPLPIEPNGRLDMQYSAFHIHVPNSIHICPAFAADKGGMTIGFWVDQTDPVPNATHCGSDGADNTTAIILESRTPAKIAKAIRVPTESISINKVSKEEIHTNKELSSNYNLLSPAEGYLINYSSNDHLFKINYDGHFTGVIYNCSGTPGISRCSLAFVYRSAIAGYRWYPNAYHNHVHYDLPQVLQMAVNLRNSLEKWSQ